MKGYLQTAYQSIRDYHNGNYKQINADSVYSMHQFQVK